MTNTLSKTFKRLLRNQKTSDVVAHLVAKTNKNPIFGRAPGTIVLSGFRATVNEDLTRDVEITFQDRPDHRHLNPQWTDPYKPADFSMLAHSEEVKEDE